MQRKMTEPSEATESTNLLDEDIREKYLFCNICNKAFLTQHHLEEHRIVHTCEKYSCDICFKTLSHSNSYLKYHYRCHDCEIQKKMLKSVEETKLNLYLDGDDRKRIFQCATCNKTFSRKNHLERHQALHRGEKLFHCDICFKTFSRNDHLKRHYKWHDRETHTKKSKPADETKLTLSLNGDDRTRKGKFLCHVCNKIFTRKDHLGRHQSVHSGEKLFTCFVCFKAFSRNDHLRRHFRLHYGEELFSCKVGQNRLENEVILNDDKKMNLDEELISCKVCQNHWQNKSVLNDHEKNNLDELFSCQICQNQFKTKKLLKAHIKIHTEVFPFSCEVCPKLYRHKRSLMTHLKSHLN